MVNHFIALFSVHFKDLQSGWYLGLYQAMHLSLLLTEFSHNRGAMGWRIVFHKNLAIVVSDQLINGKSLSYRSSRCFSSFIICPRRSRNRFPFLKKKNTHKIRMYGWLVSHCRLNELPSILSSLSSVCIVQKVVLKKITFFWSSTYHASCRKQSHV